MIPIKIGLAYILSAALLILWFIEGGMPDKWRRIASNPMTWMFWIYFAMPFISLLWSDDLVYGLKMAKRGIVFLLIPLYMQVSAKNDRNIYIHAFFASVAFTVLLALYNIVQIYLLPQLPEGLRSSGDVWQIAPFLNHIMYGPVLAFGSYLIGHVILFQSPTEKKKVLFVAFFIVTSVVIIYSGGRSGQAGYFVMIALLVYQKFAKKKLLAALYSVAAVCLLFISAYQASSLFQQRADLALTQLRHYRQATIGSSVGLRMNFIVNSWQMFESQPVLGVGVGDFMEEYARINARNSPQLGVTHNPHNQYLFVLSTTGLLGALALVGVLLGPLYVTRNIVDEWSRVRVALHLLFAVICLAESYLWRSNTGLMFVAFSAILNSDVVRNK
jgi:O-antigen ligase